jgi:ABC-2 type transport system permease protein
MYAIQALWKREIIKFLQDRGRFGGAIAQPLVFWVMLGFGFQGSFHLPNSAGGIHSGVSYLEYLFPGMIVLVVLFTAIFSTVSIVEERKSGFLQAAIVAPMPRMWLVIGNIVGGTTLALVQALLFLVLAPFIGIKLTILGVTCALLICALLSLSFGALGFAMAWYVTSTRGFLALMNFFLMPLWLLSGAFFPAAGVPKIVQWLMYLNPVTHGLDALRESLYGFQSVPVPTIFGFGPSIIIVSAFAIFAIGIATALVRKPIFN